MRLLAEGEIEVQGRLPWSSNHTFLVTCAAEGSEMAAVYKPWRGERPLWDFPDGLFRREAAAYELSAALGWELVPETVVRPDGPLGTGSLQRFVEADFSEHYFSLLDDPRRHQDLRRVATFDLLANNADRKGGHCLAGRDGRIWAIDHGLCFHPQPKLRTVIWDFAGEPVPAELLGDVGRLAAGPLCAGLTELLHPDEGAALLARAARLVERPRFPSPGAGQRPYPWPLV